VAQNSKGILEVTKHVFIPDTQITPGSDIRHIIAAGNYINDKKPDVVIIGGDWWDMQSLCSYDKPGSKGWEAKDVKEDYIAGCHAMDVFLRAVTGKKGSYQPRIIMTEGNHENRVHRAAMDPNNMKFKGFLSTDEFALDEYALPIEYNGFLEIVNVHGIMYSHYFLNPDSLFTNAIGGTVENKLRKLGHSFTMGHQQHKQTGAIYTATGERRVGLVCGRFYQEDLDYLGPQKNKQSWSGIFMKHEVNNGDYDLMEVSMKYLLKEWT